MESFNENRQIEYLEKWVNFDCPNCQADKAVARFADGIHIETRCFGCNVLFIKGLDLKEMECRVRKAIPFTKEEWEHARASDGYSQL